jgi:class 3 adenylate cyclase/pimeloyl-ACP methyl ester carboxylesterase
MKPTTQYAITRDGLAIAYAVTGSGPLLISVPAPPDNHIGLEWEMPDRRATVEAVSAHRALVRFDGRGTGLSDRDINSFSLEDRLLDLEAIVDRLGVESFALMSGGHGNQLTVAYAAAHPDRVSHVIAVNPFIHGADFISREQMALWRHLLKADFRMFTDALGAEMFGWGKEEGPRYAAFMREAVSPATAILIYEAMVEEDVSELLPKVQCPVLVVRTTEAQLSNPGAIGRFAASLPNAQVVSVGGKPVEGATPEMLVQIGRFFGERWEVPSSAAHAPVRQPAPAVFKTVLFTDIEGHTAMMQRLGDGRGRAIIRHLEELTRSVLQHHQGTEVKSLGDGCMASFRSAQAALDCAIQLQRSFSEAVKQAEGPAELRIRIGINAGEPIEEAGDLFGSAVIAAARIVGLASGGEILVSNVVRELVSGKGYLFGDRGQHELRGFEEPVRVWELRWRE